MKVYLFKVRGGYLFYYFCFVLWLYDYNGRFIDINYYDDFLML